MTYLLGAKAVKRLAIDADPFAFYHAKLTSALFKGEQEQAIFAFTKNFFEKFQTVPSVETLEATFPEMKELSVPEPHKYYIAQLETRFGYDVIDAATKAARETLKGDGTNINGAEGKLRDALGTLTAQRYRNKILDMGTEAPGLLLSNYHGSLSGDTPAYFGWPYMDLKGGVKPTEIASFVGRPASGKAQPLDAKVLTVSGFKRMGDIQVGDVLASVDGEQSKVESVHPQGKKPVYKFTFSDGRSTEAAEDHLWEVFYRDWEAPQVLTTLQLIAKLKHKRYQRRLSVRLFSGKFGNGRTRLPPYLMGALIGDGCFRGQGVTFTSADPEIVHRMGVAVRLFGMYWSKLDNKYGYLLVSSKGFERSNPVREALKGYGLWGHKSESKWIPEEYLSADEESRWELLRGLMDTDGTAEKSGGASYCTTSKKLAEQVQYLVRSLGGKATISEKATTRLMAYIVHVVIVNRKRLFHLSRKKDRVAKERTTHTNNRLTLESIEFVGEKECQCLVVTHPSHLYITDDFVVTHNSYKMLKVALYNWKDMHENVLFVSMEMSLLTIAQRVGAMYAKTNVSQLMVGGYSTMVFDQFVESLGKMQQEPSKFYVIDGNLAACVDDIYSMAAMLKCRVVFIDGGYLVRNRNTRLDRYTKVAENVELMKRYNAELQTITFASWQFAKTAVTKKKGNKAAKEGLEDIGYSQAIGEISAIVLGIMQEEGVETILKRRLDLLKGRDGQVGGFEIHWDFMNMNFNQYGLDEADKKLEQSDTLDYV